MSLYLIELNRRTPAFVLNFFLAFHPLVSENELLSTTSLTFIYGVVNFSRILDNLPDPGEDTESHRHDQSRKARKTDINSTASSSAVKQKSNDMNDEVDLSYPLSTKNLGSNSLDLSPCTDLSVMANLSSQVIELLCRIDMSRVHTTIPIPKLHANDFPGANGFDVDSEGYIRIMYRPWMKQTIDKMHGMIDSFENNSTTRIWALNGPQGIGMSYCMYLFTAMLKRDHEKYRVFYLPRCDLFSCLEELEDRRALVEELYTSFYDNVDEVTGPINELSKSDLNLDDCLIKLKAFYLTRGITVVLVFDQLNTLASEQLKIRKIAARFLRNASKSFPTFVSFSADNNYKVEVNEDDYYVLEAEGYEIQDNEAHSFCKRYDPNISTEEAMEVLALAGRIPREVSLVFKQKGDNLPQKLENYGFNRSNEYSRSCAKYLDEQSDPVRATKTMLKILLGGTRNYDQFDEKLIREVHRNGYPFEYVFTNKIAWSKVFEAVKVELKGGFDKSLNLSASKVFRSNRPMSTKGMEVERYLIMSACSQRRFCFPGVQINLEQILQIISYNFHFEFRSSFFAYPLLARFEGFDFFIYDRTQKIFYLVKTVVDTNGQSHRAKVEELLSRPNSNLRLFLSCLKESIQKVDPEIKVVEVYLVKGPSSQQANESINEITLLQMASFYPALGGLY